MHPKGFPILRSLLTGVLILLMNETVAQQPPYNSNYIPPSPNAASLGIFASVPVNYYAGLPEVGISFYDIKIKNVTVPINLQYYAGGVRQYDEAGLVGTGWALNAGGVISRTKKHLDDFSTNGYYKTHPYYDNSCSETIDQEPDLFNFNFTGYTGKFVMLTKHASNKPVIKSFLN